MKKTGRARQVLAIVLAGMLAMGSVSGPVFGAETGETAAETAAAVDEYDTDSFNADGEGLFSVEEASSEENEGEAEPGTAAGQEASSEDGGIYTETDSTDFVTENEETAENGSDTSDNSIDRFIIALDANGGVFVNEWDDILNESVERAEFINKAIPAGEAVTTVPVWEQEDTAAVFLGWSLEPDGEPVSAADEEFFPEDNCTLFALWQIEETSAIDEQENASTDTGVEMPSQEESQEETLEDIHEETQEENLEGTQEELQEELQEETQEDIQDGTQEELREENPAEYSTEGETASEDGSQEQAEQAEGAQEDSPAQEELQENKESPGKGAESLTGNNESLPDDQTVIEDKGEEKDKVSTDAMNSAVDEYSPEDFESNSVPIFTGVNNIDVLVNGESLYKFIPEEDDIYTFYSEGEYDTRAFLYSEVEGGMCELESDDDSGENNNFSISYELEKDCVYYLNVAFYHSESGDETRAVKLKVAMENCSNHSPVEGSAVVTEATCTEGGFTTYVCSKCLKEYKADFTEPLGHQYNNDGICDVCGAESPYRVLKTELKVDENGSYYVEVMFNTAADCFVRVQIFQEEGMDPVIEETKELSSSEHTVQVPVDSAKLPDIFIIKAFLEDEGGNRILSNVLVNDLYLNPEITDLIGVNPEDYDQNRTISFDDGSFGVFTEGTVIIHGNSSKNILEEDGAAYILQQPDVEADGLKSDCNMVYYYEDEIITAVHVDSAVKSSDGSVVINGSNPVMTELFQYLKIDTVMDSSQCEMDFSDLPEGVSYLGSSTKSSTHGQEENTSQENIEGEETVSSPAMMAFGMDDAFPEGFEGSVGTTLEYSVNWYKHGNVSVDETISLGLQFPVKYYIADGKQTLQTGVDSVLAVKLTVSGKADLKIPLGKFNIPLMDGLFMLKTQPSFVGSLSGKITARQDVMGSVLTQADEKGARVVSRRSDGTPVRVTADGKLFLGISVESELAFLAKIRLASLKNTVGASLEASYATAIPVNEQKEGDHICQHCVKGTGQLTLENEAVVNLFVTELKVTEKIVLKSIESYFSFDYWKGGLGECPYKKGKKTNGDEGASDERYYSEDIRGNAYSCRINEDGTLTITGVDIMEDNFLFPTSLTCYREYYNDDGELIKVYVGKYNVTEIDIHGGCEGVVVTVPAGIRRIRAMNISAEKLILAESVAIDGEPFHKDYSYSSIRELVITEVSGLPDEKKEIPEGAFAGIYELTSVQLPDNLKRIGKEAFAYCDELTDINMPEGLESIGDEAFSNCEKLKNITLPEGLERIGSRAFEDCGSLAEISIPDSVLSVGDSVFHSAGLRKITIEKSIPIAGLGLGRCPYLSEVVLSEGRIEIDDYAFEECEKLTNLKIPESVKYIGRAAFASCTGLTEVVIPDSVKEIEFEAFDGCRNIKRMVLGKNVSIRVDSWFDFDEDMDLIYSLESVEFNEGRTKIDTGAFNYCKTLKEVKFPNSLKELEWYCFRGCSSLEKIVLPEGVKTIGPDVFLDCSSLSEVTLPDSLSEMGHTAFKNCTSLTSIYIPDQVAFINWGAFEGCRNLKTAVIAGSCFYSHGEPVWIENNFDENDCPDLTVYVPSGEKNICNIGSFFYDVDDISYYMNPFANANVNVAEYKKIDRSERHVYLLDRILKEATEDEEGLEQLKCLFCGETITEAIPKKTVYSIKEASITGLTSKTYTGSICTQSPTLTYYGYVLRPDIDYTLAYTNNINAGTATLTINGAGIFKGSVTRTFTINKAVQNITAKVGASNVAVGMTTNVTVSGAKGTKSFKSSNTNVAAIDKTTGKLTAKGAGTAKITVTAAETSNYKSASRTITVSVAKGTQSITAKASASSVAIGKTATVTVTGAKGTKSFKSSDTAIATVNATSGIVTARKTGTVKITATSAATADYNAASKTVTIRIVPAATASLTAANQASGIKLTWKKVTGANGYKVYRGSTLIKTITSGSTVTYTDTAANTNGTKYTYKIVAKSSSGDSTLSKSVTVYRVARPAISSVTNSAASKMTVKWVKNAKANGYQIQYSISKTFASGNKAVNVTGASTVSRVIGSLTKGKIYYVRIRTYKTVGSAKYWSEWSAAKSVKISK